MSLVLDPPYSAEAKDVDDFSARLTWVWRYRGIVFADSDQVVADTETVIASDD